MEINFEYKRKSIQVRDIKVASITQVRDQARDLWFMDDMKRVMWMYQAQAQKWQEEVDSEVLNEETPILDEWLESRWSENSSPKKSQYIVKIPAQAQKEDLLNLKTFLSKQSMWPIEVFIELQWKKISTKISVNDKNIIKKWEKELWNT